MEVKDTQTQAYPYLLRWLHAGLALGAIFQLSSSLLMVSPDDKGSAWGHSVMEAHEVVGLVVAAVVAMHFVWSLWVSEQGSIGLRGLFCCGHWKSALSILCSLPMALLGKAKMPPVGNSLAQIVEMLGLLVMVLMGATGGALWFMIPDTHPVVFSDNTDLLATIHSWLSKLLWAYVIGHVAMVWAHTRAGDASLQRISPMQKGE